LAPPWPRTWQGRVTPPRLRPGVIQGSTLGERVFGNALAVPHADFIGNPDLRHTCSYVPDNAAGLGTGGSFCVIT
jgi:hypothetical protein